MNSPLLQSRPPEPAAPSVGPAVAGAPPPPATAPAEAKPGAGTACFHCGLDCGPEPVTRDGKCFCCHGCRVVHDLLTESGLGQFYALNAHPGTRVSAVPPPGRWAYLDTPGVRERLVDYSDGRTTRVTLRVPAMHCIACVWLLENLFRLHPGVGRSQVNFPRREVALTFAEDRIQLSGVVSLLTSIGYEPALTLGELDRPPQDPGARRRALQVGIAGFAFGNIMLFSLPAYLGFDSLSGPFFQRVFGLLSLLLALPVVTYSALDYWRAAWLAVRRRWIVLDVPIAFGLAALYAQSAFEILSGRGAGYLDSLSGLVFFLLCGRAFQQKTHDRLAFDRDYRSFFPLSVIRKTAQGEEPVSIASLDVGDRILLRNGELIPADARLVSGPALIDYSFVTGESEPVGRQPCDVLYAGGQQVGGAIELETIKPVSQSYLTSLWNHETFRKDRGDALDTLTNRYSRRFTGVVLGIALAAAGFWALTGDTGRGLKAFTSVLIVACPCALALAAPFALGTAQRLLARARVYVKNPLVIERMAQVDTIVLDKTGTLTSTRAQTVTFHGAPLEAAEALGVYSLTRHSTHPHSVRIGEVLAAGRFPEPVTAFLETPGRGLEGRVQGRELWLGSRALLEAYGAPVPARELPPGSRVFLAIDGRFRGVFVLENPLRPEAGQLVQRLAGYDRALVSGDNEKERDRFRRIFGADTEMRFNQSPLAKLAYVQERQRDGRRVMMVGDGLNDAGALRQAEVGVAVVERAGAFCPASDVIVEGGRVASLPEVLSLSRKAARIVRISFVISAFYNAAGITVAAGGWLSPVICAVLMPLSSVCVVLFACGATARAARRSGLRFDGEQDPPSPGGIP